jgi:hypothetical protein
LKWRGSCLPVGSHSDFSPKPAILLLRPQAKRQILLNLEEVIINVRYLLENEEVHPGITVEMIAHMVTMGSSLLDGDVASSHEKAVIEPPNLQQPSAPSLNFARGVQFEKRYQKQVWSLGEFYRGF